MNVEARCDACEFEFSARPRKDGTIKCPVCGRVCNDGDAETTSTADVPPGTECAGCGKVLRAGVTYCAACGTHNYDAASKVVKSLAKQDARIGKMQRKMANRKRLRFFAMLSRLFRIR